MTAPLITVRVFTDVIDHRPPAAMPRVVEAAAGDGADRIEVQVSECVDAAPGTVFLTIAVAGVEGRVTGWADFCAPIPVAQLDRLCALLALARVRARVEGIVPPPSSSNSTR